MPRNPLTPVGLRCRREALGMSRADLAKVLKVNEGVIRSWEIGKSEPRDPLSVHMILGNLEDEALECLDELLAPIEDQDETVRSLPYCSHRLLYAGRLRAAHAMGTAPTPLRLSRLRRARFSAPQ